MKLNQHDLNYLHLIETQLMQLSNKISKEGNCYRLDSKNGTLANHLEMVHNFIDDLKNNQQSHEYYFPKNSFIVQLFECSYHPNVSAWLMARLVSLMGNSPHYMLMMINKCIEKQNADLAIFCLKNKVIYDKNSEKTPALFEFICNTVALMKDATTQRQEDIRQAFIFHIKNSNLDFISDSYLDEPMLVSYYTKLFGIQKLDSFLDDLGFSKIGSLFSDVDKEEILLFKINLKTLASTVISEHTIYQLSKALLDKNFDFPKFYIIENKIDYLMIGVEKKENCIQKVQHLIHYLIEQEYSIDKDQDYEQLKNTILKVNLDFEGSKDKETLSINLNQKIKI